MTDPQTAEDRLPAIAKERIPYHPAIEERYGIDRSSWRALTDAVFPSARSIEGVILALSYCRSRNLDVFKRPVHIVPIWNSDLEKYVETVWPGIGELRTTAFRTGNYAGAEPATFGPDLTMTFRGRGGRRGQERDIEAKVTFPEWCQITVHRMVHGHTVPFPGPRVYWLETYARQGRTEVPNEMWQKRPRGQLEKCAEAAALRKAFPEEIGEQYIGDEIGEDMRDITPAAAEPQPQEQGERKSALHVIAERNMSAAASAAKVAAAAEATQKHRSGPPTPREPVPETKEDSAPAGEASDGQEPAAEGKSLFEATIDGKLYRQPKRAADRLIELVNESTAPGRILDEYAAVLAAMPEEHEQRVNDAWHARSRELQAKNMAAKQQERPPEPAGEARSETEPATTPAPGGAREPGEDDGDDYEGDSGANGGEPAYELRNELGHPLEERGLLDAGTFLHDLAVAIDHATPENARRLKIHNRKELQRIADGESGVLAETARSMLP